MNYIAEAIGKSLEGLFIGLFLAGIVFAVGVGGLIWGVIELIHHLHIHWT
jgi:hypothetical protein